MSVKESKSLQFNNISWKVSHLGEHVILLECKRDIDITKIHESVNALEDLIGNELKDIVPSYTSIAIFSELSLEDIVRKLNGKKFNSKNKEVNSEKIKIPICYEYGMDLERVSKKTGNSIEGVIKKHLTRTYRAILIGFTPGFIYADGLDPSLECARLENPRTLIPAGSIGIGGAQTGIYSLASPGGWNIIGRTPKQIFDGKKKPPMLLEVGATYKFYRISKSEFESWEN